MSKQAIFNNDDQVRTAGSLAISARSDNDCYVNLPDLESSALRECAGCGSRFVPTGQQRYCSHDCYSGTLRVPIQQRFWSKVNKNGPIPIHRPDLGQCWVWTGNVVRLYGQIVLSRTNGKQKNIYAHRYSYKLTNGPLAGPELRVCHHCDRMLCVNPAHLFAATQQENLNDARRKGRLVDGAHNRKVSDEDIDYIRANYRPRQNGKALAARFGITLVSLMRFVKGTARVSQRKCDVLRSIHDSNRKAVLADGFYPVSGQRISC